MAPLGSERLLLGVSDAQHFWKWEEFRSLIVAWGSLLFEVKETINEECDDQFFQKNIPMYRPKVLVVCNMCFGNGLRKLRDFFQNK